MFLFLYTNLGFFLVVFSVGQFVSVYVFGGVCLVILYAISAVYFAGVMVRLMLTLTPVVCILAAVAFSKVFSIYLKDDSRNDTPEEDEEEKEKNDKYYDKVCFHLVIPEVGGVLCFYVKRKVACYDLLGGSCA